MSQATTINNAISSLEFRNRGNPQIAQLAHDWVSWFADVRPWLPLPVELASLQYYWTRYVDAYASAANKEGSPLPVGIEPRVMRGLNEDLAWRAQAFSDAGQGVADTASQAAAAGSQSLHSAAREARPSVLPLGMALGAVGALGLLIAIRKAGA